MSGLRQGKYKMNMEPLCQKKVLTKRGVCGSSTRCSLTGSQSSNQGQFGIGITIVMNYNEFPSLGDSLLGDIIFTQTIWIIFQLQKSYIVVNYIVEKPDRHHHNQVIWS